MLSDFFVFTVSLNKFSLLLFEFSNNLFFKNENDINSHIKNIEMEKKKTSERSRMQELENWLHHINEN